MPSSSPPAALPVVIGRWLLPGLLLGLTLGPVASIAQGAVEPGEPWRVVYLNSVDSGLPAARLHDLGFQHTLKAAAPAGSAIFNETLDTMRFSPTDLTPEFLALLGKKYAHQKVDLVVGVGDGALDFLRHHHDRLWPGAKLLVSGLDETLASADRVPAGADLMLVRLDIDGTLALAKALQPTARRLVVIGGSAPFDRRLVDRVAAQARQHPQWQTEVWPALSVAQLRERLAALDRDDVVVYTSTYRDADGRATFPAVALAQVADASAAPLYGLYGTYIGAGAVAGRMIDFEQVGQLAAERTIAVLRGGASVAPGQVQLLSGHCLADAQRLQRHGLSPAGLPAGCDLRNAPRNLWTEHRSALLAAAALLLLQAATIAALLLQRRRRRLAEHEAAQRRLELGRAMRFAAMGELTASIAHEINQPLGAILSNADAADLLLQRGVAQPAELREILADIRRDDLRAHEVIRRLRALLEKNEVDQVDTRLHPLLQDVLALLAPEARRRGVVIERSLEADDDRLHGDPVQLQQVLINLALNAMDAMDANAAGERLLRVATRAGGDDLVLTVADSGSGIAPAQRELVFESFHTTKPGGMGLGLAIVRAIVDAHEGSVCIGERPGGGALFTLTLPRRLRPGRADAPVAVAERGAGSA